MSGTNQKRCRKSKLVPRSFKDCDDDSDNNLQDDPKNKRPRIFADSSRITTIQDQPSTSKYEPLQFDIKIEVEECDEFETAEILPTSDIKTEIINENDLFEVEEQEINLLLTQMAKKSTKLDKSYNDSQGNASALDLDHDYSPKEQKLLTKKKHGANKSSMPSAVSHLKLDEDFILKALDDLCKKSTMSLADNILAVEMRNLWGRCRTVDCYQTETEKSIQIAINTVKYWRTSTKGGEVPLMYKCYVCEKAWWHLGPFEEHVLTHSEELRVASELQKHSLQYNIVAYSAQSSLLFKDFNIDSDCWRCGYGFDHHVNYEKLNLCEYCSQTFSNCFKYRAHETLCVKRLKSLIKSGPIVLFTCHICDLKLLNKEVLEIHYLEYHSVRSDLPMVVDIRNCTTCYQNYSSLALHYCNRKHYSVLCQHCAKRFPSKVALNIHLQEESNYPCAICHTKLPKKCMLAEHMLKHSNKFMMLQKCLSCQDNILLLDEISVRQHKVIWHKQKIDKRRNYFDMVLVPREFIEEQKSSLLVSYDMTAVDEELQPDEQKLKELRQRLIDQKELGTAVQMIAVKEENDSQEIDFERNLPSTSIFVKQEDEDFETMFEEKIIKEMQKNTNFTEEDEGYEYLLSSVFNSSNCTILNNQIAEVTDEFEEIINRELKNKSKKQSKNSKEQSKNSKKAKQNDSKTVILDDGDKDRAHLKISTKEEINGDKTKKILKCECHDCDFECTDKQKLIAHRQSHKTVVISCSKCTGTFNSLREYLDHLTEHGLVKLSCPECMKIFTSFKGLTGHIKVAAYRSFSRTQFVDKERDKLCVNYQCKKCGQSVEREALLDHWETHLVWNDLSIVKVEILEEDGDIDVDGVQCDTVVDDAEQDMTPEVMQRVLASLVDSNKRNHPFHKMCLACGRSFERRNDCKRHHIEHLLANAYSTKVFHHGLRCQICHSTFERPDAYKHHMRDHGHLPVYKCELCFKTFSDSSNYVKHKKTHSSMYICDICKKKFQAKHSIIKHMECHSNTDPIKCMFCHKVVYTEADFSRHMRSAHNQSLFKYTCIICKKRFRTTKDKWDHMWVVHKERTIKADCPICNAEFRKLSDVKNHLRVLHNQETTVMNSKLFNQLVKKLNNKDDATFKSIEDDVQQYVVVRNEENSKQFEIYNKNVILSIMKTVWDKE